MNNLDELRKKIDGIDMGILELLSNRIDIAKLIAQIKNENNLQVFQPEREKIIIETIKKRAIELGLPEKFVLDIYELILDQSKKSQKI